MANEYRNKVARQGQLRLVLAGIKLHLGAVGTLVIAGAAHAVADLVSAIEADIVATDATDQAHAALSQSVAKAAASHALVDPLVSAIKQYVLLTFGNTQQASSILADFGYAPRRVPVISPDKQLAAIAKAKATREARGTKGKKQKAAIHGAPPAPSPEPATVTAPAAALAQAAAVRSSP